MGGEAAFAAAGWAPSLGAWLLTWLVKGSLLLALLFPLAALLRRFSPSARHVVWTAGLAVTLALPLLSSGVLPWRIEVPITSGMRSVFPALDVPGAQDDVVEHSGTVNAITSSTIASTQRATVTSDPIATTSHAADRSVRDALVTSGMTVVGFATLVWAAGVLLILIWLFRSAIRARHLARTGTPLADESWTIPLMEAADRLDLAELPRLVAHEAAAVPIMCGIFEPSIVLPVASANWTDDRRRAVLCHELGHIRRRDLVSHLLGRLTCALYWFQPLAWNAARRMRAESERACDDLVLYIGTRASSYADHLLEIAAAGHGGTAPAVALPMAQPREFEARLLSILAPDMRREPIARWQSAVLAGLVLLLAQPLVALSPARSAPVDTAAAEVSASDEHAVDDDVSSPVPQREPASTASSSPAPSDNGDVRADPAPAATPIVDTATSDIQSDAQDPRIRASLIQALQDPSARVRRTAAWSLSQHRDSAVAHALIHALRTDTDHTVREMSAWALAGRGAPRSLVSVVQALSQAAANDDHAEVRLTAVWALGNVRVRDSGSTLEGVVRTDESPQVRAAAAWALGTTRSATSIAALASALSDADASVRETAAWGIGNIEPERAPQPLAAALRDSSANVRKAAAWALGHIEDPAAASALEDALGDENAGIRTAVVWALGRMPHDVATPALTRALRDAEPDVRAAAAAALGGRGSNPWPWPRPWPRPRPFS